MRAAASSPSRSAVCMGTEMATSRARSDARRVERLDGQVEGGGVEAGTGEERRGNRDALRLMAQLVGGDEEDLSLAPHGPAQPFFGGGT